MHPVLVALDKQIVEYHQRHQALGDELAKLGAAREAFAALNGSAPKVAHNVTRAAQGVDAEIVETLAHPMTVRRLSAFLGRSVNRTRYQLRQAVAAGKVKAVATEPRKGRPSQVFQAV